jgi:RHS repeat-associated protein
LKAWVGVRSTLRKTQDTSPRRKQHSMPVTRYTTVSGQILAEKRGGAHSYYGSDPLGSTAAIYDSSGNTTDTYSYWPYGEMRASTGSSTTPFKFCGAWGYYAEATGRLYVRARFYRDKLARWHTMDPLWPMETAYAYCLGRPSDHMDPSGLSVLSFVLGTMPFSGGPSFEDAVTLASELCGQSDTWWIGRLTGYSDIVACKRINDMLSPCREDNPNWDGCGRGVIGTNPTSGQEANKSNWPCPAAQLAFCDIGGEYCCKECEMRVCCHFGPFRYIPKPRVPYFPPFVPGPTMPGTPIEVPRGRPGIWA